MSVSGRHEPGFCSGPECRECERLYEMAALRDELDCDMPLWSYDAEEYVACRWCPRCVALPYEEDAAS